MNSWNRWWARLGIAGACLFVTGCGGSGPDPASDPKAADGAAGGGRNAPPAAAAAQEPAVAAATEDPKAQEAKPPAQGQGGSTTAEMLAMAQGAPGGSNPPPSGGSPPPPANPPGAAPGGGSPPPGPNTGGSGPRMGAGGGMGPRSGAQGGPPDMGDRQKRMQESQKAQQEQNRANQQAGARAAGGGMRGGPAGGAAPGAAGASSNVDLSPADFHTPTGAVMAFMSALKARDLDRLNESTALRASQEATAKNQELFKKIFDLSLSDSELDDLAKKLEGYQIAGENPPKSTGRVDVVLQKASSNGSYIRRKVTVRHEKKGWGVLDITGPSEFKMPGARPRAAGKRY
jgi:hypothetical protein